MKLNSQCIECLMARHFKKAAQIESENDRLEYLLEVMRIISESSGEPAPILTARSLEIDEKYLGITAMYAAIKEKYNSLMLEQEQSISECIESSRDPLQTAILFSRAGNYIDFGTQSPFSEQTLHEILTRTESESPDEHTYARFRADMEKAGTLLWIS